MAESATALTGGICRGGPVSDGPVAQSGEVGVQPVLPLPGGAALQQARLHLLHTAPLLHTLRRHVQHTLPTVTLRLTHNPACVQNRHARYLDRRRNKSITE